jgi:hypothetical protein
MTVIGRPEQITPRQTDLNLPEFAQAVITGSYVVVT